MRFLKQRQQLGHDRFDEVWQGVYHVAPAPNAWHGYAALGVAEVLSGPAEAAQLIALPRRRGAHRRSEQQGGPLARAERRHVRGALVSSLLGTTGAEVVAALRWPS